VGVAVSAAWVQSDVVMSAKTLHIRSTRIWIDTGISRLTAKVFCDEPHTYIAVKKVQPAFAAISQVTLDKPLTKYPIRDPKDCEKISHR
jgi:hypothetical protein